MAAIAAQGGLPGGQCYTRIWIGGLPRNSNVDEVKSELKRVFGEYGYVLDVCVITTARDVMSFVQFENEQDAYRARETMNGSTILGSVVKVNYAVIRGQDLQNSAKRQTSRSRSRERQRKRLGHLNGSSVLLEGLPSDITTDELAEMGSQASEGVSFANLWKDGRRLIGLVSYDTRAQASKAKRFLDGCRCDRGRHLRAFTIAQYNESQLVAGRSPSR